MKARIKIEKPGPPAPCLEAGQILCRGCPGWNVMYKALLDPASGWKVIHCAATGLTLRRED